MIINRISRWYLNRKTGVPQKAEVDSLTPLLRHIRSCGTPVARSASRCLRQGRTNGAGGLCPRHGDLRAESEGPLSRLTRRKWCCLLSSPHSHEGKVRQKPMWILGIRILQVTICARSASTIDSAGLRYVIFKGTAVLTQDKGGESASLDSVCVCVCDWRGGRWKSGIFLGWSRLSHWIQSSLGLTFLFGTPNMTATPPQF